MYKCYYAFEILFLANFHEGELLARGCEHLRLLSPVALLLSSRMVSVEQQAFEHVFHLPSPPGLTSLLFSNLCQKDRWKWYLVSLPCIYLVSGEIQCFVGYLLANLFLRVLLPAHCLSPTSVPQDVQRCSFVWKEAPRLVGQGATQPRTECSHGIRSMGNSRTWSSGSRRELVRVEF